MGFMDKKNEIKTYKICCLCSGKPARWEINRVHPAVRRLPKLVLLREMADHMESSRTRFFHKTQQASAEVTFINIMRLVNSIRAVHAASGEFFSDKIRNIAWLDVSRRKVLWNESEMDRRWVANGRAMNQVVYKVRIYMHNVRVNEGLFPCFGPVRCYNFIQNT